MLPLQGAQVQSLVRALRSFMLCGRAQNKISKKHIDIFGHVNIQTFIILKSFLKQLPEEKLQKKKLKKKYPQKGRKWDTKLMMYKRQAKLLSLNND